MVIFDINASLYQQKVHHLKRLIIALILVRMRELILSDPLGPLVSALYVSKLVTQMKRH